MDKESEKTPKSFGAMSAQHWSRARAGTNAEAIAYYRERSLAPGVEGGGSERNFYCMQCDGVISHDYSGETCPHCKASLAGMAKRYFNWVEINEPPPSDFVALLPILIVIVAALGLVTTVLWWWSTR